MSVKVATWNVKRSLGNEYEGLIFDGLEQLNADVVVINEAFSTDDSTPEGLKDDVLARVNNFADKMNYDFIGYIPHQESGSRGLKESVPGERTYMMVLGREVIKSTNLLRLYNRNAYELDIVDKQTGINIQGIAAHFDDRNEFFRQKTMIDLMSNLDPSPSRPNLLLGDFNAMPGNTRAAQLLRTKTARFIANHSFTERMSTITNRSIEMANGSIMRKLSDIGFKDADLFHHSTYKLGKISFGQLDHILVAKPNIVAGSFEINNFSGSDHKAISAIIHTNLPKER